MRITESRRWLLSVAALLSLLALGVSGSTAAPSKTHATPKITGTLTIATPGIVTSNAEIFVATAKRYFANQGLAVKVQQGIGRNTLSLVASGGVDIVSAGVADSWGLMDRGQRTVIISAETGGGNGAFMVGSAKTAPTIEALRALPRCRIATFGSAGSVWGYTNHFNETLGLNCTVVGFGSVPLEVAALVSGNVDAAVASYATLQSVIASGEAKILIDSRKVADRQKYIGAAHIGIEGTLMGLPENLAKKRVHVVKFMRGLEMARKWMRRATNLQIANTLTRFSTYRALGVPALTQQIAASRSYWHVGSTNGYITRGQYARTLNIGTIFGTPGYKPDNPIYAYGNMVDMSYWIAANGKPRGG